MSEATTILVANWGEALKQLNVYLALGATSAISALALRRRGKDGEPVTISGGLVPMAPETAQQVLLGVCLVAGALAAYAAVNAGEAVRLLRPQPEIVEALCTFPSVATASLGSRLLAAVVPSGFAALALLGLREKGWVRALLLVAMATPYVFLAVALWQLPCPG